MRINRHDNGAFFIEHKTPRGWEELYGTDTFGNRMSCLNYLKVLCGVEVYEKIKAELDQMYGPE